MKRTFKTGMTLVATTIVALFALFIVSSSVIITQIASVFLIGMFVDILNSWVLNLGLLMWYVKRKM
jgi:preprotein translocase subunit SecF